MAEEEKKPEGTQEKPKKKVSKKQQAAVHKYVRENYDRLELTLPKGGRERIRKAAEKRGLTVNAFVKMCISKELDLEDQGKPEDQGD